MVRYYAHITADAAPNHLSISRTIFTSRVYSPPRYFVSSAWGSKSPPQLGDSQRTMASDLEVLMLLVTWCAIYKKELLKLNFQ